MGRGRRGHAHRVRRAARRDGGPDRGAEKWACPFEAARDPELVDVFSAVRAAHPHVGVRDLIDAAIDAVKAWPSHRDAVRLRSELESAFGGVRP